MTGSRPLPLLAALSVLAVGACGGSSPEDRLRGSWAPVEEVGAENPTLVLTFEEDGVVTAAPPDAEASQGEYTLGEEGAITMEFEQGDLQGTLSEGGDTLTIEFRGRSGKMVRIDG